MTGTGRFGPGLLLVALGLAALAYSGQQLYATARFLAAADRVTGTVVDPAPHPKVRFVTADGVPVVFTQNGFVSRPAGAEVPVAYLRGSPAESARVVTFWTTWGTAGWLLPFGIVAGLLPLLGLARA